MYNYQDFIKKNYMRGIYNNENTLENVVEGFNRGNAFKNLFVPYKNYRVNRIVPRNEREELLLKLSQASFYAHEINLLLDVEPNNREMIQKFNEFRNITNTLMNEYETKYGPINIMSDALNKFPFSWENNNFPWDQPSRRGGEV